MTRRGILGWSALAVVAASLAALTAASPLKLVLLNESRSLPKGVYVRDLDQTVRRGSIVAVRQMADARAYLSGLRMPADTPLLKRVAAVGGDAVCEEADRLLWDRGEVKALRMDRRGVALPRWQGCRRLRSDELLVLGDTPTSFDSRYFGPVPRRLVSGVYVEAISW